MIHVRFFVSSKPSMSDEEFHPYWRETHAPIVKRV